MNKPVYSNEPILFSMAAIISLFAWGWVLKDTNGWALLAVPFFFISYLFAQSGFISHLRGQGALVSDAQFPDIQERVRLCAERIGLPAPLPKVYILHGNGMFNAFATRFLRRSYIVLLSDVLDALEDHPDAINFYIGHEMGHLDRKHLFWAPILIPGTTLPLLGAAYSRAREYTADLYGAACCEPASAQHGLAALAVGGKRYKTLNIQEYIGQIKDTSGFWMSFHELVGNYPWLIKRYARVSPDLPKSKIPSRSFLAYIPAIFIPHLTLTSFIIIYIFFISVSAGNIFAKILPFMNPAAMQENSMEQYKNSLQQSDAVQTTPAPAASNGYEVGKTYMNKQGATNIYLGGDPSAASNWQSVPSQSLPQQQQQAPVSAPAATTPSPSDKPAYQVGQEYQIGAHVYRYTGGDPSSRAGWQYVR